MHTTYNKMMNNLEALNLSVFRENLPQYLDMISMGEKSVTDALYELTEKERQFRDEKAIITQIHKSALPSGKSVDGYDFSFQPSLDRRLVEDLATLRFIEGNENILFVGSPGTGKTHLAAAIGTEAARHRYSVYFIICQDLMNQLKKAELENRLEARLRAFMRHRLLIIDEIGLVLCQVLEQLKCPFFCHRLCNNLNNFIACYYVIHFLLIVFFLVFIWRLIFTMGMDSHRIVEAFYIAEYD